MIESSYWIGTCNQFSEVIITTFAAISSRLDSRPIRKTRAGAARSYFRSPRDRIVASRRVEEGPAMRQADRTL